MAGPRSAVGSVSASRARGPGLDTRSGYILLFLLSLIQKRQLSVTREIMCTKYWLTPKTRRKVPRLADCPDMTILV